MPSWKTVALRSQPMGRPESGAEERGLASVFSPGPSASWKGFLYSLGGTAESLKIPQRSWQGTPGATSSIPLPLHSGPAFFAGQGGLKEMAAGGLFLGVRREEGQQNHRHSLGADSVPGHAWARANLLNSPLQQVLLSFFYRQEN